ncbi:hypothetical protein [Rhodococcus sp. NPDC047139]|uniref:hypothetical protein n=1 Tax=Rhodococcus sp. NPDC047139 TaxID=3155141 RepID=UPI0033ECAD22
MTTVDTRSTLRSMVFDAADDADLVSRMAAQAGPDELARRTSGSRIPSHALRIVEKRILTTALGLLDEDPGPLFAKGLGTLQNVMTAARATRADPGTQVVENILDPYRIPVRRPARVTLFVEEHESACIDFELSVVFTMGRTSVSVRNGAVEFIECEAGTINVSLSLAGTVPPLLQRKASFPVRWDVRPPIVIPLPEPSRPDSRRFYGPAVARHPGNRST